MKECSSRLFCLLELPDSAWRLPIPASSDSKDIQKAAAETAEAFRSTKSERVSGESSSTPETPESTFFMNEEASGSRFFINEEAPESRFFMDEEALFYMPGLIANIAEGLMLPPPQCLEIGNHYTLHKLQLCNRRMGEIKQFYIKQTLQAEKTKEHNQVAGQGGKILLGNLLAKSYYSDPLTDSSSTSSDNSSTTNLTGYSSVILASNNPKKPAGRKKFRETRHPIYRGVRKRNSGKWVCEVREPNKKSRIWLGTYPTVEMAARAHDVAALALRGHSACLNFEDSVWRLPIPASSDTKDIQKAASEAAETFRPLESEKVSGESGNTLETPENMFFMNEEVPESRFFMDEEALFYMPGLLADMAEGLMLPPPQCLEIGDHAEVDANMSDMSLWSYSI
ncbi:hypothetical protein RND71_030121 [Anisodus tanguticus]|uniref:AP2/ERF domain-containing protein n=1 Tax=Anisodus tanguticus TaxID=243964 RepID=A0AAE1RGW9_9SOLA|nr:hypothetical protein RND71_030121 [Anisodus tanguticus]